MERDIIIIDEDKCDGCGLCVKGCHEGALQLIDGKARLISDLFCDGLGACIGECPQGAIKIEKREAEPYDEIKVLEKNIIPKGTATLKAHLQHLKDHGAKDLLDEARDYLKEKGIDDPSQDAADGAKNREDAPVPCCPGLAARSVESAESSLAQWPVQLHLLNPLAPYFKEADLLLAADCTPFAYPNFHKDFIEGKTVAVGCPKLDSGLDSYVEKITSMIDDSKVNTITVLMMQVPCCSGLLGIVDRALEAASRKVPVKQIIIGIDGKILKNEWR